MRFEQAEQIAQSLKADLEPFCERIEVGGSVRRKKPEVKDIELICIPKFGEFPIGQMSLEGEPLTSYENLLFEHIAANRDRFGIIKMGEKYAQVEVFDEHPTGVRQYSKVDVFTVAPETWGYIFMLRTGPAEFSKWIVTELKRRGYMLKDGAVWNDTDTGWIKHNTPDEGTIFDMLNIDDIKPEFRFKEVMWK